MKRAGLRYNYTQFVIIEDGIAISISNENCLRNWETYSKVRCHEVFYDDTYI